MKVFSMPDRYQTCYCRCSCVFPTSGLALCTRNVHLQRLPRSLTTPLRQITPVSRTCPTSATSELGCHHHCKQTPQVWMGFFPQMSQTFARPLVLGGLEGIWGCQALFFAPICVFCKTLDGTSHSHRLRTDA